MVSKSNKRNNIPYYITAFSATLLFAGIVVFAVAPYIEPLASIADLGFIIAAFSIPLTMLVFALSYKAVRQNKALAEKETQLAGKEEEIEAISKTIAEQETQLVKKTEEIKAQNQTLAKQEAQLTEEVKKKDDVIASMKDQLAEKDRMFREEDNRSAESLLKNISGDGVVQPRNDLLYEVSHNGKELVFAPELSAYLKASLEQEKPLMKISTPFSEPAPKSSDEMAASSGSNTSHAEQTKAAPKKTSGWFSTKAKTLGALSVISAIASSGVPNYPFYLSNSISPANNSTGVGDLYNNNYCPSSSYTHPNNTQTTLDGKLNQIKARLEAAEERGEENFGVNPKKHNFVDDGTPEESTLTHGTETVAQSILTSVPSMIKKMFFNLLTSSVENMLFNLLTSNVEVVEESIQVDQNDPCYTVPSGFVCNNRTTNYATPPIQAGKTVKQNISTSVSSAAKDTVFGDIGQDSEVQEYVYGKRACYGRSSCHSGDYQAPLPGLQGMTICCPSIPRSAPPSGP